MTHLKRALLGMTAAVAALGGLMVTSAPAASAAAEHTDPAEGQSTSQDVEASKVWKHVWHTAPSYFAGPTGGYLFAGDNYFYCQEAAGNMEFKGYQNHWWLLTDDDSGNTGVWVNAVFISGGNDNEPISGVPYC